MAFALHAYYRERHALALQSKLSRFFLQRFYKSTITFLRLARRI
jgi:hypothetical protein